MSFFSAFLTLIGYTRTNSSASAPNEAFDRQFEESMRAFENRPIHKILTTAIIDSIADNDLLQVINPFNPLDDEFYKLEGEEDLFALQVAYIRAHKEAFVDTST